MFSSSAGARVGMTLFVLALSPVLAAAQSEPVRTPIELVRVDFSVLAQDGQLVSDLTSADVTLEVDGKARDLRSFQFVRLASATSAPAPRVAA